MVAVPWLVQVALFLRAYRSGVARWIRQTVYWGFLALALLLLFGQLAAMMTRIVDPWALRGFLEILIDRMGDSTVTVTATWIVSVLLIAGAYLLAQIQFLRMELPPRPTKYALIDYGWEW